MSKSTVLPDKLRELRKAHSYTQDYVATALGVARQTYSHYETGKRTPDAETLYKLAGLYDISVDDLIQLTLSLDRNIYYDAPAPTQSGEILDDFLKYLNSPENQKKYQHFTYQDNYSVVDLSGSPDLEKLAAAYDLPFLRLENMEKAEEMIDVFLEKDESMLMECLIDPMDLV